MSASDSDSIQTETETNTNTNTIIEFGPFGEGCLTRSTLNDQMEDILVTIVSTYPRLLCYIDEAKQTNLVVFAALKADPFALEYVIDQKSRYCRYAIDADIKAYNKIKNIKNKHQAFCVNMFLRNKYKAYKKVKVFNKYSMVQKRSIVMKEEDANYYIKEQAEIINYFKEITFTMISNSVKHYIGAIKYFNINMINVEDFSPMEGWKDLTDKHKVDKLVRHLLSRNIHTFKYLEPIIKTYELDLNLDKILVEKITKEAHEYYYLTKRGVNLSFLTKSEWIDCNPYVARWMLKISDFKEIMAFDSKYIRYFYLNDLTKEHCICYLKHLILSAKKNNESIESILYKTSKLAANGREAGSLEIKEICIRANMLYRDIISDEANLNNLLIKLNKNNSFDTICDIDSVCDKDKILLDLIEGNYVTYNDKEVLLKLDGMLIGLLEEQTDRLIQIAITQNPLALEYVRAKNPRNMQHGRYI